MSLAFVCIDVFKAVIEALPYKVHYEFIPFEDANGNIAGTYNELVYQVHPQLSEIRQTHGTDLYMLILLYHSLT